MAFLSYLLLSTLNISININQCLSEFEKTKQTNPKAMRLEQLVQLADL